MSKSTCPNCQRPATPAELSRNHGVCQYCRKSFATAHARWAEGKSTAGKNIVEVHIHKKHIWDGEENPVDIVDFDFDEIDRHAREFKALPADVRTEAAAALARIFVWTWGSDGGANKLRCALLRFSAFFGKLRPDLVEMNQPAIAAQLGITKAMVNKASVQCERVLGFRFHHSASAEGRRNMSVAMKASYARRRKAA